jgi:hypothetical protein
MIAVSHCWVTVFFVGLASFSFGMIVAGIIFAREEEKCSKPSE